MHGYAALCRARWDLTLTRIFKCCRAQVWLSTSSDLHCDALRDLRALGAHINVINNCQALDRETRVVGLAKEMREGVLFMWVWDIISSPIIA